MIAEAIATTLYSAQGAPGELLRARGGIVNVARGGETSWHGFATAIVKGMRTRGVELQCRRIIPIATVDFPTRAKRPANSRLRFECLEKTFGIVTMS